MAPSKKKKTISAKILPPEKRVIAREDPDSIYAEHPSWSFSACDGGGNWSFTKDRLYHRFWDDVLPKLQSFETMTWASILIDGKKQHHSIPISALYYFSIKQFNYIGEYDIINLGDGYGIKIQV